MQNDAGPSDPWANPFACPGAAAPSRAAAAPAPAGPRGWKVPPSTPKATPRPGPVSRWKLSLIHI
eukprot:1540880-Prymnesium_polylepis.1